MQRRDLFKLAASGAALASTSIVVGSACQREAPKPTSLAHPVRAFELPAGVEPAMTFQPLAPKR
jgi:hypothetical protein